MSVSKIQLVESSSNKVMVSFSIPHDPEKAYFYSEVVERLVQTGIKIPTEEKENFGGKSVVMLDDPNFPNAFKEIFFKAHMDVRNYYWKIN